MLSLPAASGYGAYRYADGIALDRRGRRHHLRR
jgi:hypothetical protein